MYRPYNDFTLPRDNGHVELGRGMESCYPQWRSQDGDVMWAQHGPNTQLFLAVLQLLHASQGHGAHAPQDFAMFEPNNTCVLTIQLHFDFFRLIQLFQKLYKLPTINTIKNKQK